MEITALIITKNAESTIRKTCESILGLTNTILVVDDYSTDKTKQIARELGGKIILHHAEDFGSARAFALSLVKTEWTLVVDADEVLTNENKDEIRKAVQNNEYDGYNLHFRNHLFGHKLRHGELHKKLVLFRTAKASISPQEIHEQYRVEGKIGELHSEVLHYSYQSYLQIKRKFFSYAVKQAREYKRQNKRYGLKELFLNPLHMFYARYIKDKGYRDGISRIILDKSFAAMEFLSYVLIPFVKTKKRVSVDCGSYLPGSTVRSGIDRILEGISSYPSRDNEYYWFSYNAKSPNRIPRFLFSQVWLPLATLFHRCDVYLGVAGNIPYLLRFFPLKKIVFLYDFGFLSSPEKYVGSADKLASQTEDSIKIADTIIVLNSQMYDELLRRYPQYGYKVETIAAGADHLLGINESPLAIQEQFILTVGVVKPVKRIDLLLSAVGDRHCVVVGQQEKQYMESLKIGKEQRIEFINEATDAQLKWLYTHADCMVYTSEHEGFCFPVLEALTLGLPVIALNLPLFREYKKHFPHLTLTDSVEGIRKELLISHKGARQLQKNTPYEWKEFNHALQSHCQPPGLTRLTIKKIAFIVVLYKTPPQDRERLEEEIKKIMIPSYAIYWIDNSTNGKGYAAGINEGIIKGLMDNCDTFIALNPDISLTGISSEMIMDTAHEFDVWGFGMRQNGTVYYGGEIDRWRLSGGLIKRKPKNMFSSVDFISGSVMGFSRAVVRAIGLWDESYFMYYEDVDYCKRAQRAGYEVGINGAAVYDHFEVSQMNEQKRKWISSSRWRFFWKYANVTQKIREIVRLPKTIGGL